MLTENAVAVNAAADAPEGITTLAGTFSAAAVLESATVWPLEVAGEVSVTEQEVVPAPVKAFWLHDNEPTRGAAVAPLPVSRIETAGALLDEIVICPATVPTVVGLN